MTLMLEQNEHEFLWKSICRTEETLRLDQTNP